MKHASRPFTRLSYSLFYFSLLHRQSAFSKFNWSPDGQSFTSNLSPRLATPRHRIMTFSDISLLLFRLKSVNKELMLEKASALPHVYMYTNHHFPVLAARVASFKFYGTSACIAWPPAPSSNQTLSVTHIQTSSFHLGQITHHTFANVVQACLSIAIIVRNKCLLKNKEIATIWRQLSRKIKAKVIKEEKRMAMTLGGTSASQCLPVIFAVEPFLSVYFQSSVFLIRQSR